MSARSDGIEAQGRGDNIHIDCPYKYGSKEYKDYVNGFLWSEEIEMETELDIELPEIPGLKGTREALSKIKI